MSSTVIPTLRYRDARGAIGALGRVLGFETHLLVEGENARVEHAQLTLGPGMIMISSVKDDALGEIHRETEQGVSQAPYLVIEDVHGVHDRAVAEGWAVVMPLTEQDYGGWSVSVRDSESHVWHVGSYDPWAKPAD